MLNTNLTDDTDAKAMMLDRGLARMERCSVRYVFLIGGIGFDGC